MTPAQSAAWSAVKDNKGEFAKPSGVKYTTMNALVRLGLIDRKSDIRYVDVRGRFGKGYKKQAIAVRLFIHSPPFSR